MTEKILNEFTFGTNSRYTLCYREGGAVTMEAQGQQIAVYPGVREAFLDILELFASFPPDNDWDRLFMNAMIEVLDAEEAA
jgi:hypothetical protein